MPFRSGVSSKKTPFSEVVSEVGLLVGIRGSHHANKIKTFVQFNIPFA